MVKCRICYKNFLVISNTHLKKTHDISIAEYKKRHNQSKVGFPLGPNTLPKSDLRYQKWLKSLKKRPPPWSKGKTKETDLDVKKISETFKKKKIDNFAAWRQKMRKLGLIISTYPPFKKSEELAFLIGMTFGDGHIQKFPRTERLVIALNSKYPKLVDYVADVMSKFFQKQATVKKDRTINLVRIWIYQKQISQRLEVPAGDKRKISSGLPNWIWNSKRYIIGCLKGLFEAEGSLSIHLPTYTYNFAFSNKNQKLLDEVENALRKLGFNPEVRSDKIRLRKKKEVFEFKDLIKFREFDFAG